MAPAGASLPAASVPDSESLRRALLMASWQRDQDVGRRRLRQRWAIWAALRIGLAALMTGALGWALVSLQPEAVDGVMARLMSSGAPAAGSDAAPRAQTPGTAPAPAPPVTIDTRSADATATAASAAQQGQALPPTRPALRLDLDPSPVSSDITPQPSTPGDTRT
jgi:hypothetical protein